MTSVKEMELEIKLRLDSFPDYLKLLGFVGSIDNRSVQTNAFFDDHKRTLQKEGWALRVREQQDLAIVTLKGTATRDRGLTVRREMEAEIDRSLARELIHGTASLIDQKVEPVRYVCDELSVTALQKVVQFQNERQTKDFRIGDYDYLLEIDKTSFQDGSVDYELEVELDRRDQYDVVVDRLQKMFSSLGIDFNYQADSKFKRALQKGSLV